MLRGLSSSELQSLLLSVGTHRGERRLSPLEVAHCFQRALDSGETTAHCAAAVGFRGTTMVSRFARLLRLDPDIHHLVGWGQGGSSISFTAASELGRLGGDEQAAGAAAILTHQLGKEEVRQLVQLRLRSTQSLAECVQSVLRMRPQVTRLNVYIGTVTDDSLRERLEKIGQAARDHLLHEVLAGCVPQLREVSAKLGVTRFTLVGGEELAAVLRREAERLEVTVNRELGRRTT